jgi:hypothetical protein
MRTRLPVKLMAVTVVVAWAWGRGAPATAQVRTTALRQPGAGGPRIVLNEQFRVGSADGANDAFARVVDVVFDGRGRIVIADDLNHQLSVFDASGRFLRRVGRQGAGPGEFQTPWVLAVDRRDSLFVWDAGQGRVSVFDPEYRFVRDFGVRPQWLVTSLRFLPDGRLLVAAYGRNEPGVLHLVERDGRVVRTYGPSFRSQQLGGFEASLLGGSIALGEQTLAYSNKSPYQLEFYDAAGNLRSRCTGDPGWTTPVTAVVRRTAQAQQLQWNRYVHASRILYVGGGRFLNVVVDPVANRRTLDLVTSDCRLLRRTVLPVPLTPTDRSGSRLVAVQNLEYPQVIVYDMRITP